MRTKAVSRIFIIVVTVEWFALYEVFFLSKQQIMKPKKLMFFYAEYECKSAADEVRLHQLKWKYVTLVCH